MGITKYFKELKESIDAIRDNTRKKKLPIIVTGKINGPQGIGTFFGETRGISCKIIKSYNQNDDGVYGKAKIHFIFDLDTHKYIEIPLLNVYDDESLITYSRSFPVNVVSESGSRIIMELTDLPSYLYDSQEDENINRIDIILKEEGILNITIYTKSYV